MNIIEKSCINCDFPELYPERMNVFPNRSVRCVNCQAFYGPSSVKNWAPNKKLQKRLLIKIWDLKKKIERNKK